MREYYTTPAAGCQAQTGNFVRAGTGPPKFAEAGPIVSESGKTLKTKVPQGNPGPEGEGKRGFSGNPRDFFEKGVDFPKKVWYNTSRHTGA